MSTSTALSILEAKPSRITAKPTKKDRDIYLLSRRGWSDDAIAIQFKLKPLTVKEARDRYQLYRDNLSFDEQDLALAEMTSRVMPQIEKVLVTAMKAEHQVNVGRGNKVIMRKQADHATRLKAVETVKGLIETSRPKGGGIQINTQVNNDRNGNGGVSTGAKSFDFEARLRAIRERKGLANEASDVMEAEYEDEETDALADELSELGIELEEDDDEDEGEE